MPAELKSVESRYLDPNDGLRHWIEPRGVKGLISVIVPTYNRQELVVDALNSVRDQRYRPIELVVVDDGSIDDTAHVIESWIKKNSEKRFLVKLLRQANRGLAAARNAALIASCGEFIQFLDSDDVIHPGKLEMHASVLETIPEADFVIADPVRLTSQKSVDDFLQYSFSANEGARLEKYTVGFPGFPACHLYRRTTIYRTGPWDERLNRWIDWEYCARQLAIGLQGARIDSCPYGIRIHQGFRIADLYKRREGLESGCRTLTVLEERLNEMDHVPRCFELGIANLWLNLALMGLQVGDPGSAQRCLNGAAGVRRETYFRARVSLIGWILRRFGCRAAAKAMGGYSAFMRFNSIFS